MLGKTAKAATQVTINEPSFVRRIVTSGRSTKQNFGHPTPGPIFFHFYAGFYKNYAKQECIPVGSIPPAAVARDQAPPTRDQTPPGTRHTAPPDQAPLLSTETLTHATENITLPQTSFAGDNNRLAPPPGIGTPR